jgi:hypothetical protein
MGLFGPTRKEIEHSNMVCKEILDKLGEIPQFPDDKTSDEALRAWFIDLLNDYVKKLHVLEFHASDMVRLCGPVSHILRKTLLIHANYIYNMACQWKDEEELCKHLDAMQQTFRCYANLISII